MTPTGSSVHMTRSMGEKKSVNLKKSPQNSCKLKTKRKGNGKKKKKKKM